MEFGTQAQIAASLVPKLRIVKKHVAVFEKIATTATALPIPTAIETKVLVKKRQ